MWNIKTFIFIDLETTGLPQYEQNRTKITEMCLMAVQADHIELGCFPRVVNKLSVCLNPNKLISPQAERITGLSNELLENQSDFCSETVNALISFVNMCRKPACFVAHNGNRFDFPILKAHIHGTGVDFPTDLLCLDSLHAFKKLDQQPEVQADVLPFTIINREKKPQFEFNESDDDFLSEAVEELEKSFEEETSSKLSVEEIQKRNETTPKKPIVHQQIRKNVETKRKLLLTERTRLSYNLVDCFQRLTCRPPSKEHEAEGDVVMLLTCAATYAEKFVEFANNNAKLFCEIPMMTLGRPL